MEKRLYNELNSVPICITTKTFQKRKHHKKRINKKWLKKYGVIEYERLPTDIMFFNGTLYMTKKAYNILKGEI